MNKNTLIVVGKILLSIGLISWLLRGADLQAIWQHVKTANFPLLAFAFVMFYLGYLISAIRWRILMRAQNIEASIPFLLESFTIGMFFNNFLPSTIGGDASRMYDVYRLAGDKMKAVSIILTDRFLGMFSLIFYGFVAVLFAPAVRAAIPGIEIYLGLVLLAMITVMWMIFGGGHRLMSWFLGLKLGVFSFLQKIVGKVNDALSAFRGRTDVLGRAVVLSFMLQLNVIVHFVLITIAMDIDVPVVAIFIIIPISVLIMLIPVSINGVGVRETVFVFLFGIYAISSEQAIAFAWVALAMILTQGIVGGIVFAMRKRR